MEVVFLFDRSMLLWPVPVVFVLFAVEIAFMKAGMLLVKWVVVLAMLL